MRLALLAAIAISYAGIASAETFEIQMLNKGAEGAMVFEPAFVHAQPGDTIIFKPTDKSHDAATIVGMIPEGAEPFKGKINQEISVTLTEAGVYGIKCTPHYAMGMVALIQVGDPVNLEQASAVQHKGKAKQRFETLFDQVQP